MGRRESRRRARAHRAPPGRRRVELRPARRQPARGPAPDATGTLRLPQLGVFADTPSPRPGWYAYRVTGPAELPPWAVEVALTIERPLRPESPDPRDGSSWPGSGASGSPWPVPGAPELAGPGVHGLVGPGAPELAGPDVGPAGPEAPHREAGVQAVLLLRAPGRMRWLAGIAEAVAEVETAAGCDRRSGGGCCWVRRCRRWRR
jgi:hypothetical protein